MKMEMGKLKCLLMKNFQTQKKTREENRRIDVRLEITKVVKNLLTH